MKPLFTPEIEERLKKEITPLWNQRDPILNYQTIAVKLQVGVPGTIYEKLKPANIDYFCRKFRLHRCAHNYYHKEDKIKKKKTSPSPRKKYDPLVVAEEWANFDGTWTEFLRLQKATASV